MFSNPGILKRFEEIQCADLVDLNTNNTLFVPLPGGLLVIFDPAFGLRKFFLMVHQIDPETSDIWRTVSFRPDGQIAGAFDYTESYFPVEPPEQIWHQMLELRKRPERLDDQIDALRAGYEATKV